MYSDDNSLSCLGRRLCHIFSNKEQVLMDCDPKVPKVEKDQEAEAWGGAQIPDSHNLDGLLGENWSPSQGI